MKTLRRVTFVLLLAVSTGAAAACATFGEETPPPTTQPAADAAANDAEASTSDEAGLEAGAGDGATTGDAWTPATLPANGKYVFVSTAFFRAGLTALANVDNRCENDAKLAGLPSSTYVGWVANGRGAPLTALGSDAQRTWYLPNGTLVASFTTLTTGGNLAHAIDLLPNGTVTPSPFVWTGTTTGSETSADNCGGWMSTTAMGVVGDPTKTTFQWTNAGTQGCNATRPIYCFEK